MTLANGAMRLRRRHIDAHREATRRRRSEAGNYWWENGPCQICGGVGTVEFLGLTTRCPSGCSR